MITFKRADLFAQYATVRVNTVNCVGVMGAGVARAFKRRYPEMFRAYQIACQLGEVRPGKLHVFATDDCMVVNFPTKDDWRQPSRYEYVADGLTALVDLLDHFPGQSSVVMPALGCGNGGLDWAVVRPMIERAFDGNPHHIVVLEPNSERTH